MSLATMALVLAIHVTRAAEPQPGPTSGVKPPVSETAEAKRRPIAGRVADSEGRPVAGANVNCQSDGPRTNAVKTDAEGRFQFPEAPAGATIVLVEAAGFRFHGQLLQPAEGEAKIALRRLGEPAPPMKTLPPALPKKEALDLARRLFMPYAESVLKTGRDEEKLRVAEVLARFDPARVLEEIEKSPSPRVWFKDYLRRDVLRTLLADDPEEALAVAESMQDPTWRPVGYLDVFDASGSAARERKLELLTQALVRARAIQAPGHRVVSFAKIAERWLDLGEKEQATQLLREGQKIAKELPTAGFDGYCRGAFAEELGQIDLNAALDLIKGLSDAHEYDRHHGNLAHELAGRNPAEAERVLGRLRDTRNRDYRAPRVCYRMALVDLARARKIATGIGEVHHRAYAYGVMAQALADSDKKQATVLLERAFADLRRAVDEGQDRFQGLHCAAGVAGALLPVAETIDPQLVPEFLWRAVSLRPRPSGTGGFGDNVDAMLSVMLARYDRPLARTIVGPLAARAASSPPRLGRQFTTVFVAAALIDSRWAAELIEKLPDIRHPQGYDPKNHTRLAVTKLLTLGADDLWKEVQGQYLYLWTVDTEDL